jgi:hypothetical protein
MSMETLRQGAQNARVSSGGKGGTRAAYFARWKPPTMKAELVNYVAAPPSEEAVTQVSEPIVIVKGEYADPFQRNPDGSQINPVPMSEAKHIRVHTYALFIKPKNGGPGYQSFRDMICSAGPDPHSPQPCVGCWDVDHGNKDARPKDQWVLNIAHLSWYHESPYVKDGAIQMKKDNSGPVMIKNECHTHRPENIVIGRAIQNGIRNLRAPRQCDGCQQGHPFVFGDHRVIQVGLKHLKNLFEVDEHLAKMCMTCGTNMLLFRFDCGHCNATMVDIVSSGWTNAQISDFGKTAQQCRNCGTQALPAPYYECGFDDRFAKVGGGCASDLEPVKGSLFDSVIWAQRKGEKTESQINITKTQQVGAFKTPDGRPLADHLAQIVKSPFNLDEMYKPDSTDEQAEMISKPNPYASQQPQFQQYGQQPQGAPGYGPPQGGGYGPPGYQQQQGYAPPGAAPQPQGYPSMPMPGRPDFGK